MSTYTYITSPLDEQAQGSQVEAGREAIRAYAENHCLQIDREFIEAPGNQYVNCWDNDWRSRDLTERPVGKQLCELLRSGDAVIVDHPFLRMATQLLPLANAWKQQGVTLHLAAIGLSTDQAVWKAMEHVITIAGRFDRVRISESTSLGIAAAKARGGPRGGRPAPGWTRVGPPENRRRVPDLDQRKVMERIMQLRAMGWGWRRISSYLTKHRVMWKKLNATAPRGYTLEFWCPSRCQKGYEEMLSIIAARRNDQTRQQLKT